MKSILFLDDEEAILASLRSLFRRGDYAIRFASDGLDALRFLEREKVDVIVSDMRMPGISGIEFLNRASDICPAATRIMLSGFEDKTIILNALSKGLAHHYVLKPWDDMAFKALIKSVISQQLNPRELRLKELLGTFNTLPSPPKFHTRLRSLLTSDRDSLGDIVGEIEKIPALVAKVIRVSNSVYFGTRRTVTTVREAVVFIGTEYIAGLVMAIEAFQNICEGLNAESGRHIEELWNSSLRRATIAKAIAERWPASGDPSMMYVASLLQDIGFVVRMCTDPAKYKNFLNLCTAKGLTTCEADLRTFSVSHEKVGAALLDFWNFPHSIVEGVLNHHGKAGDNVLTTIIQLADALDSPDPSVPHDPLIDPLIDEWRRRLGPDVQLST
jgi:HD-like signal output (HDOD) protein/CheY-like chemotaxis protein